MGTAQVTYSGDATRWRMAFVLIAFGWCIQGFYNFLARRFEWVPAPFEGIDRNKRR